MMIALKWSVPVSRFEGETQMERMLHAQEAVELIEAEVREAAAAHIDGQEIDVSAQFMEFYDLPDGGHGHETLRARFLVAVSHSDRGLLTRLAGALGAQTPPK
jgi:hypothetical protein